MIGYAQGPYYRRPPISIQSEPVEYDIPVTVAREPGVLRVKGLALLMDEPDLLAHMAVDA